MSLPHSLRPPAHRLDALAGVLLDALEPGRPAFAVGLRQPDDPAEPDELELHLHDLPTVDPVDALTGFTAPADWQAFGMVASARVHRLDEPRGTTPPGTAAVVHLVDRQGHEVTLLDDGDERRSLPSTHQGRVPDRCRRVLGLATAPPEVPVGELVAHRWLDQVATAAVDGAVGWLPLARCWPMPTVDPPLDPEGLGRMAGTQLDGCTWEVVRGAAAVGLGPADHVPADVATWADEGSFSRLAFEALPELDDLVEMLVATLSPACLDGLATVLGALAPWRQVPGCDP